MNIGIDMDMEKVKGRYKGDGDVDGIGLRGRIVAFRFIKHLFPLFLVTSRLPLGSCQKCIGNSVGPCLMMRLQSWHP